MVEHQVEHQVEAFAETFDVLPGAQLRVDGAVVDDRKAIVGRVGIEGQEVDACGSVGRAPA